MTPNSVRRVRVHVPAHDGWPESVRGVGSEVYCGKCGAKCRGRTHAEARKALRFHRLDGDCPQATAVLNEHRPDVPPVTDAQA